MFHVHFILEVDMVVNTQDNIWTLNTLEHLNDRLIAVVAVLIWLEASFLERYPKAFDIAELD